MDLNAILNGFFVAGRDSFPAHLCTQANTRDPGVWDAPDDCYHLVLAVDHRFQCYGSLRCMKPYVVRDDARGVGYGWVDRGGDFLAHVENPTYPDHAKVVAWKPCPVGFDLTMAR